MLFGDDELFSLFLFIARSFFSHGISRQTQVWNDPAGSPEDKRSLRNDLDLTVVTQSGSFLYGNGLEMSNSHFTSQIFDRVNPTERVTLENPQLSSIVSVRIEGHRFLVGQSQKASLVVTGKVERVSCPASMPACPSSCSGHGICNTTTLTCQCAKNYFGPSCNLLLPELLPNNRAQETTSSGSWSYFRFKTTTRGSSWTVDIQPGANNGGDADFYLRRYKEGNAVDDGLPSLTEYDSKTRTLNLKQKNKRDQCSGREDKLDLSASDLILSNPTTSGLWFSYIPNPKSHNPKF